MKNNAQFILLTLIALLIANPAFATDPLPGDSCAGYVAGNYARSGGPEIPGAGHFMVCDGTNWVSFIDYADTGSTLTQIAYDSGSCTAIKEGRIRYSSTGDPPWEFCDGSAWVNFKQPRCQDNDAGECYLDALRSNDDSEFIASNIKSGVNILNVTGSYTGSGDGFLGFADITGQYGSTLTTSDVLSVKFSGGSKTISISGDGSPEYRICANYDCNTVNHTWSSTAGAIDEGEYLQLRLTSSASNNTANIATVTVGTSSEQWSVTTTPDCIAAPGSQSYATIGTYTYSLPANTENCIFTITVKGAAGAPKPFEYGGGDGGGITFEYTPSGVIDQFDILVGGGGQSQSGGADSGGNGLNTGRGGAAASSIKYNAVLLAIAGGGGGAGHDAAGATAAPWDDAGTVRFDGKDGSPNGGQGGDNDVGGTGPDNGYDGGSSSGAGGGTNGGAAVPTFNISGGGEAGSGSRGGGGGGGYGGGGGGGNNDDGSGGGGGGYVNTGLIAPSYFAVTGGTGGTMFNGQDGSVTISW